MIYRCRNRRRGMTTLEVTVSLFVGTIVLMMLYYCFDLTTKKADAQTLHAGAISEALKLSDAIDKVLGDAIDPKALGENWSKAKKAKFEKDLVGVYSTATVKSGPACALFTIDNFKAEGEEKGSQVRIVQTNLGEESSSQSDQTLGDPDYFSSIEFFYAEDFDKNLNAEIKKRGSKKPKYVRYQISVVDKLERGKPVTIVSGVALP